MKSRLRSFAAVVAIFTIAALVLSLAATMYLRSEFTTIERQNVLRDLTRSTNVLNKQLDSLNTQLSDWGSWDDTYNFVQNHNSAYVNANLTNTSLQNIDVGFMLFINAQGKTVEAKGVDIETGEDATIPQELAQAFASGSKLLSTSETSSRSGYMAVSDHILLFGARPILNSQGEGPYQGTIVFARYLLPTEVQQLASLSSLTLSYYLIADPNLPSEMRQIIPQLTGQPVIRPLADGKIAGYDMVKDVYGKPLFVARVEEGRSAFMDAQRALLYYLAAFVGVIVLATVTSIYASAQLIAKDRVIKLKDEFFSMATHEIRTPLAAIRGNSQLLDQIYGPSNDEDFKQMVGDIHSSSERLIRMVTNFLDLARLEQDRISLSIESFALKDAVDAVVKEMQGIAAEQKLTIAADLPTELPRVSADKDRVKQILYNLMGNALKFTEHGSIKVTARQEAGMVVVSVADTGRGISAAGKRDLFKKFQQTRTDDAHIGSGLGLYISKVLIGKMGGIIRLESSEEGKGSVFSFSLPCEPEAPEKS